MEASTESQRGEDKDEQRDGENEEQKEQRSESNGSGNNSGSGRRDGFSASQLAATERPVAGQIRLIARAARSASVHDWSPARPSKRRPRMSSPLQSPTRRSVFPFCSGARTSQAST